MTILHGDDSLCGIKKKVLFASKFDLPEYTDDTKVVSVYSLFKMHASERGQSLSFIYHIMLC